MRAAERRGTARRPRRAAAVLATVLVLVGCRVVSRSGDGPTSSVAAQVARTHRLDVDLAGPMPTRAQLGLTPGQTEKSYDGDPTVATTFRLTGGGSFTVPATTVLVTTTFLDTTNARSPGVAVDDARLPVKQVAATQAVRDRDEARALLLSRAALLGIARDDVETWYADAPADPAGGLSEHYFTGTERIGYVDVEVGVFLTDHPYVIWRMSWDPPVPGRTATPSATTS